MSHTEPSCHRASFYRREIGAMLVLSLLILLAWCAYYCRVPGTADFHIPTCYKGDALFTMGLVKGFSEIPPLWNVHIEHLGAPYSANWNDFPLSEKLMYYPLGLLARYVDPGVGANIDLILAHLFSALGFYVAARYFGAGRVMAVGFSLFYGLSSYIFMRALSHLILSFCGHIPLMLVVIDQGLKPVRERMRRSGWLAALVVFITALMSPYYWFFFLAMMGLVGLVWLARGSLHEAKYALWSAVGLVGVFLLGQSGYYISEYHLGPNTDAMVRSLPALTENGLRLPGLIMPAIHVIRPWANFAQDHYFSKAGAIGEGTTPFLGIVGVIGLIAMTVVCFVRAARGRAHALPTEAWAALFAIAFSVIGGLDYLLGSFGFVMLRSVNRYSVIVLACVLLFMAARLLPRLPRLTGYGVLAVLLFLSGWELSGLRQAFRPEWGWYRRMEISDRAFTRALEEALPADSRVFTLPFWVFPEAPMVYRMGDYEHFRPYIWSKRLSFSYGSDRGRRREQWQQEAVEQTPEEMVRRLEKAGFAAIVVNRKAYQDDGAKVEAGLRKAGAAPLTESPDHELVAYRIKPAATPELPIAEKPTLLLGGDFYGWEQAQIDGAPSRWSWSSKSAKLHVLAAPVPGHESVTLSFQISTLKHRNITILIDGREVGALSLHDGERRVVFLQWSPSGDRSVIYLKTDRHGEPPGVPNDTRSLAFCIFDPDLNITAPFLSEPKFVLSDIKAKK